MVFQIQPMMAKALLPIFGGTVLVWAVCLLFFQSVLLLGYAFSNWLIQKHDIKKQFLIHGTLVLLSIFFLPYSDIAFQKLPEYLHPGIKILLYLLLKIGLPYFVISCTMPLLQNWYASRFPEKNSYRIFSFSNFGAMLALLSYPLIFETYYKLSIQTNIWSILFYFYVAFIVLSAVQSRKVWNLKIANDAMAVKIRAGKKFFWTALSFCGVILMLSYSNTVCQDIASMPFLWVLPLGLYLLSFIVAYEFPIFQSLRVGSILFFLGFVATTFWEVAFYFSSTKILIVEISTYFISLFLILISCHGQLARMRASHKEMSVYYLCMAIGGALGSLFISFIVPLLFKGYWELHFSLLFTFSVLGVAFYSNFKNQLSDRFKRYYWLFNSAVFSVFVALWVMYASFTFMQTKDIKRNFFGVLKVVQRKNDGNKSVIELLSGRVIHGSEFADQLENDDMTPKTYYGSESGVGILFSEFWSKKESLKTGVIGLGVGTLASYNRENDEMTFYEINPEVHGLSKKYFNYLPKARGKLNFKVGDGRLLVDEEENNKFDIIVVDGFSGDAIPIHLITQEALRSYFNKLLPNGSVALNITNKHLDVLPVLRGGANSLNLDFTCHEQEDDSENDIYANRWILLKRKNAQTFAENDRLKNNCQTKISNILWTDQYSNLLQVLK